MPLGPIELIVRDVDDKGRITGLGLSFEPAPPTARVPVFLSAGEIRDRIAAFLRRRRAPAADADERQAQAAPEMPRENVTGEA